MTDTSRFTKNLELVKRGNPNAQYHFGLCYRNGEGVDQDHKEAIKWLKKQRSKDKVTHNLWVFAIVKGTEWRETIKKQLDGLKKQLISCHILDT